jgi:hypothetical protein
LLNKQVWLGLSGIILLVIGLVVWAAAGDQPQSAVNVTIPGGRTSPLSAGPLSIDGVWSELRLKTAANQELKLPQQSGPISISCK